MSEEKKMPLFTLDYLGNVCNGEYNLLPIEDASNIYAKFNKKRRVIEFRYKKSHKNPILNWFNRVFS